MPDRVLRVAAAQAEAVPGEVAHNAITVARLVVAAAQAGVRLAVFPELFLTAYHPPVLAEHPSRCDVPADEDDVVADLRLDPIRRACRKTGVVAVIGASVARADGARRCSALLAEPSGSIRAVYDKQHLCGVRERELFTPGERSCTIELDSWALGLGICYDGCFPEHARAAALDGAHGYLCPSGYVVGSHPRRALYYPARALDNTFYVVFANPVGGTLPWRFDGGAAIYDPQGQPVGRATGSGGRPGANRRAEKRPAGRRPRGGPAGEAPDDREALVVADLDPEVLGRIRGRHTMLADVAAFGPNLGDKRSVVVC